MPREKKKRGRRAEQKNKRKFEYDDEADAEAGQQQQQQSKRQKSFASPEPSSLFDTQPPFLPTTTTYHHDDSYDQQLPNRPPGPADAPFVGLLDEEEQEYFKRADDMLELNQFEGPEERSLFLANVYREAEGKELKLANSQSCSRLLERLILLSTPDQLKNLFQKFSGHFLHLVQHRFASHCCEALFINAAPFVTLELTGQTTSTEPNDDPNKIVESMENLFLHTINELQGYVGYLMTERFASHALRVLLLVLAGQPLATSSKKGPLRSKSKEQVTVNGAEKRDLASEERDVPDSFGAALQKLIDESISGLDTSYLRALATHKIGNPVLQILLQTELKLFGKQRAKDEGSLLHKLIPNETIAPESESAGFISNLTYDAVGSRLVEVIVIHAPGRLFKNLYKQFFKERLPSLARNEIAGYVASKVLERLGRDDLHEAVDALIPQIDRLVERNRTAVIRTAVERCAVRGVDTKPLAAAIEKAYSGSTGFDIARLLTLGDSRQASDTTGSQSPTSMPTAVTTHGPSDKVHASLLAQAMLSSPGALSDLIFDALLKLSNPLTLKMAFDASSSRVVQAAITAPHASVIFRRKMIQSYYGHFGAMALDPAASRVLDAIWKGTHGLAFIRERIAEELAENEASLRESGVGRHVWRKWEMDLWRRRRGEWVTKCRESVGNDGFLGFPEDGNPSYAGKKVEGKASSVLPPSSSAVTVAAAQQQRQQQQSGGERRKTAIELARERHAARKLGEARAAGKRTKKMKRERRKSAGEADQVQGDASTSMSTSRHQSAKAAEKERQGSLKENVEVYPEAEN